MAHDALATLSSGVGVSRGWACGRLGHSDTFFSGLRCDQQPVSGQIEPSRRHDGRRQTHRLCSRFFDVIGRYGLVARSFSVRRFHHSTVLASTN